MPSHLTRYRLFALLIITLLLAASAGRYEAALARASSPQQSCTLTPANDEVNLRIGPGDEVYAVAASVPNEAALPVLGQSDSGAWLAVMFPDPVIGEVVTGWIAARVATLRGACDDLPALSYPDDLPEYRALMAEPVLPAINADLRAVFERGQLLGNDPRAFTTVGDCNTEDPHFLTAFDARDYDLDAYARLQPTVDHFAGWWAHDSLTGRTGYNALTMLEPLFADPALCQPAAGEGPLACEYRLMHPSAAVMMFGPNDLINLNGEQFAAAVREIVELSLDRGVIPVLTTFTWHMDRQWLQMLHYNLIVIEIGREYGVPVINFWRAAQDLPNLGLVENYTHLTVATPAGYRIAFDGAEHESGYALRNLLTLQTLDRLRAAIIAP